jgi:tetratricopeptide (TPR) repeat protein
MFLRGFISALIPFVLMTGSLAQIQGTDTLFRPSDLVYFSMLERESFSQYFDGKPDYFKMIVALNANSTENELVIYRDWISNMIQEIRHNRFDRLSEEKKINQIISSVSKALLISFQHQASFSELFSKGYFNYFTAASAYAIILDELDIPYEIHEVQTGISILAYPDDERITIDIDGPGSPFFRFEHGTRSNFIEFLRESNAIDEATFTMVNSHTLFERYYFANHGLSLREMTGMIYLNSAINYLNRQEPENAYAQFEKAFILYPCYKIQYLLMIQLNSFLAVMDYRNLQDLGYLIKASRLIGFGMEREMITGYLQDIIHQVLTEEQDLKGMQDIFDYLQEYLADEALKKDFSFRFYYETGRFHFNDEQYSKALASSETAYSVKPDDEYNQNLLVRSLGGYILTSNPGLVLEKINLYDSAYTGIAENKIYLTLKQQVCLEFFGEAFQLQDAENGEHYMGIFEEIADKHPEISIDYLCVGRSYSSAAIYYYRKGMIQKSREAVEKGLKYAPHNIELKMKLKSYE